MVSLALARHPELAAKYDVVLQGQQAHAPGAQPIEPVGPG
jgi:hypothetical protein